MYIKHKSVKESAYHTPYQIYITQVPDLPRSFYEVLFSAGFSHIRVMEVSAKPLEFTRIDVLYNEKAQKRLPVGAQPIPFRSPPATDKDVAVAEDRMRAMFNEKEKRIALEEVNCTLKRLVHLIGTINK